MQGIDVPLRWCPAGSFTMGSPKDEPNKSKFVFGAEDQVRVTLTKGFWMAETETTQELYESVTGTNPAALLKGPRAPVETVSWEDAVAFCVKLTERERSAGRLSAAAEYRLPTEAEWEYACRAGTTATYGFGDDKELLKGYGVFGSTSAAVCGSKLPNPHGLFDLHGNVWEWCHDQYIDKLPGGANPEVDLHAGRIERVLRGGGWTGDETNARSSYRFRIAPDFRYYDRGFRLSRTE
jgi:formylglycine-generating enzyme required for sulfatase activity